VGKALLGLVIALDLAENMGGNPDDAALVFEGQLYGLQDPVVRIGSELHSPGGVKLLNSFQEAEISYLDKIRELYALAHMLSRYRVHQFLVFPYIEVAIYLLFLSLFFTLFEYRPVIEFSISPGPEIR